MNIQVKVKQLGKRKPTLDTTTLNVPNLKSDVSLQEFIEVIVEQQVNAFNERIENPQLISFLLPEDIQSKALQGKVSFGDAYSTEKANIEDAQVNAVLAFKDGLFKLFQDDSEIETLETTLHFTESSIFTFIRLTFLSGGY